MGEELSTSETLVILRRHLGGTEPWQLSAPLGTMAATRMANRDGQSVAVKLTTTAPEVLNRLAELQVTPPLLAAGKYNGRRYVVQQAAVGEHPDPDWFTDHLGQWASLVWAYLGDPVLHQLLPGEPFTIADAVTEPEQNPHPRGTALRDKAFVAACVRWQEQAAEIRPLPAYPIHPDAHMNNYVVDDDRLYLLDWDGITISDTMRDIGIAVWGFLPRSRWARFLEYGGLAYSADSELAIYWWSAYKMLTNANFCDKNANEPGAQFHARAFIRAVSRRPWRDRD